MTAHRGAMQIAWGCADELGRRGNSCVLVTGELLATVQLNK